MSAIAGLYRRNGAKVDRHDVDRMLSVLAHRGPDGPASWVARGVALGQAAHWTTPEAPRERLPLADESGHLCVTADARLDNRGELIAALGVPRPAATDIGDGELILRAYERWGEGCVRRLVGDFAFAIWDDRANALFCARDHIGVKPFYYTGTAEAFLFASEIKALLTSPLVPYRLDAERVADHLVGLFDDPSITFYRDIKRLPAGHTLVVGHAGTRIARYWSLDTAHELALGSDDAYTDAFRECFAEAVRSRLRSSMPVGSLLSGGLDSSSIVGMARRLRGDAGHGALDTFTAIFPGLPAADLRKIDERAFVEALVAQDGLAPHYVRADLLSPLAEVECLLDHLDEPLAAPNLYLSWAMYRAGRDCGVRVMLDGLDGDTTVSHGLEVLAALARGGKVARLAGELRALSRRYHVPAWRLLWQFGLAPLVPGFVDRVRQLARRDGRPAWIADAVIKPELARRVGVAERAEAAEAQRLVVRSARETHARAMRSGLIPYALEAADKAAAAFGIEARYPFFDRRLMELCLSLPAEQKLQAGWTRAVMRRAMGGILPEEVRWRSHKATLAPNFTRQLLERDRDLLEGVLADPAVIEDYVDVPALRRAYDRYVAQPWSERDALTLHRVVMLALWLQRAKIAV